MRLTALRAVLISLVLAGSGGARAGELTVVSVAPAAHSLAAPVDAPIVIRFDRPVRQKSVTLGGSLYVFGRWSGSAGGTVGFADGNQTVTLSPNRPFSAGESVMVVMSHDLEGQDGSPLRMAGYSYQFWTNARRSPMDYVEIDRFSTRTIPAQSSRAYGGVASDLNGDGFVDLTIVNEDSADLRVFLNRADRSGLFNDFLQPTFPVNDRASPSEPADFNRDGAADICVANINTASVSILLGAGDGTFLPQQEVAVGPAPRGVAVLDVDGDGDIDIVNTNSGGSSLSLLLNDGQGLFGAASFFEGGGSGEWALAASDMNSDGILDLVVGLRNSQLINVRTGNGDGTFTPFSSQSSDGSVWMLVCGDVNGDGREDVAVANSTQNRSAILLGDGQGHLAAPVRYAGEAFPIATDLGDLDGDNDLDWITSNVSGQWFLYANNGQGVFSQVDQFAPPQGASCSIMLDFDNDGDLDLALIDEFADQIILMRNSGLAPFFGDGNDDCHVALGDWATFASCLSGPASCAPLSCGMFDYDDDCRVDMGDFRQFQRQFTGKGSAIPGCNP